MLSNLPKHFRFPSKDSFTLLCVSFWSVSIHATMNVKAEHVSVVCLSITEESTFIYGKTT